MALQLHPVRIPLVKPGDDLAEMILDSASRGDTPLQDGDVLVITHKVVSKAEGRLVELSTVEPSQKAQEYSLQTGKDPRVVELVLRESRAVRRIVPGVLITETRQGFVCANSGIDKSNVEGADTYVLLPLDPDTSARAIRLRLRELGVDVAVIISDTHGRAHKAGEVNVAIGASGLSVLNDRRGEHDLFGYELKVKTTAVADELASAAELVIGQADEGIPAAIIRGYKYRMSEDSKAADLVWPSEKDLFP
jgi:coenzyme F420-0:L-glutamate ligase / coenzyme F420-1:gamma-L-glutamate ligase